MSIRIRIVALLLLCASTTSAGRAQAVKLRIEGSELRGGVPERISFIFVNLSDQSLRMPPVSPCSGHYSGHLTLMLEFSPAEQQTEGRGGGCGSGGFDFPSLVEQARAWKIIPPHQSFTVTYTRSELSSYQEAAGTYEFWGKYDPPQLTTQQLLALENAGIDFPREALVSERLRFTKPE